MRSAYCSISMAIFVSVVGQSKGQSKISTDWGR